MNLRAATTGDVAAVTALLSESGLSTVGVDPGALTLIVADDDGAVVGAAAIETHGRSGFLRSVVVDPRLRGASLGTALVSAAVGEASGAGLDDLWLLTDTAEGFFAGLGWRIVPAAELPATMHLSPEYTARCSDSAAVMVRDLRRP